MMTNNEFDLIFQLEIQAERMHCLSVLLESFDSDAPFSLFSADPDRQKEERLFSSRFLTAITDLSRFYAQDMTQTAERCFRKCSSSPVA